MELLVLSDSHGKSDRIAEAFSRNKLVDYVIFLGDGLRDLDRVDFGNTPVISVRGNCDVFGFSLYDNLPTELILNMGEYTLMIAHGHTLGVKQDIESAAARAAASGADILLFGHTHTRLDKYFPAGERIGDFITKKPLRLFNPGSIGSPAAGAPSFGIVGIRNGYILTSHGEL